MGCRVGMSTDPDARIAYWQAEEGHTGGEVLACNLSYDEALERETQEARDRGCVSEPGGVRVVGGVWSVYHVWGGKVS